MDLNQLKDTLQQMIDEHDGHAAVAFHDPKTQAEILINEKGVFPSASLIKNPILAYFYDRVTAGDLSLDDQVTLTKEMKCGGDGILKEFVDGHTLTLFEIATLMIIISDNAATNILIEKLGEDKINAYAKDVLEMPDTDLQRRLMDLEAAKQGKDNFTSAGDQLTYFKKLFYKDIVNEEVSEQMLDIYKRQQVTGRLDLYLPLETPLAHKTGDLDYLEHDCGLVWKDGAPYIICVLTEKSETNKDGRELIGKINRTVFEAY